ncbi:MAG: GNAT family N-acetyltransferase [Clostridia bacterium]
MITYTMLNRHNMDRFLPLWPEAFPMILATNSPEWFACGAEQERKAVGLVVAQYRSEERKGFIRHCSITPGVNHDEVKASLIHNLANNIAKRGGISVHHHFGAREEERERFSRFYLQLGFQQPVQAFHTVLLSAKQLAEAPWIKNSRIPSAYSCFSWGELTLKERIQLERNEGNWYPYELSPFHGEGKINLRYSLGLRYNGNVIGWLIVEPKSAETALIRSLFVREPYAQQGAGIRLFARYVQLTARDQVFGYLTGAVDASNRPVLNFIQAYCRHAICDHIIHYEATKRLP